MFKITSSEILKIVKTLEKADFAINVLEKNSPNGIVFLETKKEVQDLTESLISRYDLKSFEGWQSK